MTTMRREALDRLRHLGSAPSWESADVALLGSVLRVSTGDEGEEGQMVTMIEEADALLLAATAAATRVHADLPDMTVVRRWLADPRGPWSEALATIDALGKITAGLATLSPGGELTKNAEAAVASLAKEISVAARSSAPAMLAAAIAASERIAEEGVAPGPDDALIALSDVVGIRLEAALRGEPLEPETSIRARPIDAALSQKLSLTLSKALRKATLDIAPDLLELATPHASPASLRGDVMLHQATEPLRDLRPLELFRGVSVVYRDTELEVSLDVAAKDPLLLVPILNGEPGTPCTARGGAHARETIFTLSSDKKIDGYALVVGDRVVFLRRV